MDRFTPSMVGQRVEVIATGERGNCTCFECGTFWVLFYGDVVRGYGPGELQPISAFRRLVRRIKRELLP